MKRFAFQMNDAFAIGGMRGDPEGAVDNGSDRDIAEGGMLPVAQHLQVFVSETVFCGAARMGIPARRG
jgi:hypothetical protein